MNPQLRGWLERTAFLALIAVVHVVINNFPTLQPLLPTWAQILIAGGIGHQLNKPGT